MWIVINTLLKRYIPIVTLPIAGVVGFLGYHIEGWISDKYTPAAPAVKQQREDRLLTNLDSGSQPSKTKHSPLEVNLSPSLSS